MMKSNSHDEWARENHPVGVIETNGQYIEDLSEILKPPDTKKILAIMYSWIIRNQGQLKL